MIIIVHRHVNGQRRANSVEAAIQRGIPVCRAYSLLHQEQVVNVIFLFDSLQSFIMRTKESLFRVLFI